MYDTTINANGKYFEEGANITFQKIMEEIMFSEIFKNLRHKNKKSFT